VPDVHGHRPPEGIAEMSRAAEIGWNVRVVEPSKGLPLQEVGEDGVVVLGAQLALAVGEAHHGAAGADGVDGDGADSKGVLLKLEFWGCEAAGVVIVEVVVCAEEAVWVVVVGTCLVWDP
jgi:hypothetical protein